MVGEGCRWLWVRVNGLPADAAVNRAGSWSRRDELAALLLERQETWSALMAHAWGVKPLPDTLAIAHPDRPVDERPAREARNDPEEISRFFAGVGR